MRRLAPVALALAALAPSLGCSAVLNFNECNQDADCAKRAPLGYSASDMFCTSDHLCVVGTPDEKLCSWAGGVTLDQHPTVIGGLFRLSGAADAKDTSMADAAILAANELVKDNQRPIALVMCDTAGPQQPNNGPTQATRALERVVKSFGAVAIVGPTTSGDVVDSYPFAVQHDVLVVSPSATSPTITSLADNGLVWRTAASDNLQAKVLAQQAKTWPMPATPLNITYVSSNYGVGLEVSFIAAWGGTPVNTYEFNTGDDPNGIVGNLAKDTPAVSLIIADDDAAAIVHALSTPTSALASTKFLMTDGAKGSDLLTMPDPSVLSRIRGTGPGVDTSSPVFTAFRGTYVNMFGEDPTATSFVVNTYDALYVTAIAVAAAPSPRPTGQELALILSRMSNKGGKTINVGPVDYVNAVTELAAGGAIDIVGTSGPLDFDNTSGDVVTAPIEVWTIDTSIPTDPKFVTLQITVP